MAMTGNKVNVVLNWRIGWFGVRDEAKTGALTNIVLCAVSCVLSAVSSKHNIISLWLYLKFLWWQLAEGFIWISPMSMSIHQIVTSLLTTRYTLQTKVICSWEDQQYFISMWVHSAQRQMASVDAFRLPHLSEFSPAVEQVLLSMLKALC